MLPGDTLVSVWDQDREIRRARRKEDTPYQSMSSVQKPAIDALISSPGAVSGGACRKFLI